LFAATLVARNAALPSSIAGFLARPFVRCALLMGCLSTFACNLALFGAIH
jgi:hypothetical protein